MAVADLVHGGQMDVLYKLCLLLTTWTKHTYRKKRISPLYLDYL